MTRGPSHEEATLLPDRNGRPQRVDYQAEIARLDAISRERALDRTESLLLERYISRIENKSHRAPYGNTKELARLGIERRQVG